MNNFILCACDTDSIFFKKEDESPFTEEEMKALNDSLNQCFGENISWEPNGYFHALITLKAKNYVMFDGKTIKYKGSALKSSTMEPAIKQFLKDIIDAILDSNTDYLSIYNKYVKEIDNIQDIRRWASKKTISKKVLESTRTNETKLIEALQGTDFQEGDKVYVYFDTNSNLKLIQNFNNDYNKDVFYKKLYNAALRFQTIMDAKRLFLNYSLKRNKKILQEVLNNG